MRLIGAKGFCFCNFACHMILTAVHPGQAGRSEDGRYQLDEARDYGWNRWGPAVLNYGPYTLHQSPMTNKKQPPAKKPVDAPPGPAENPFLNAEFYARMRDYTERDAAFSKELKSIAEHGAGKKSTDARFAPSLELLRGVVKKGLPLDDMLARIALGAESGLWEPWLSAFGFELRGVNYAKTGPRNARLALDISLASKANPLFANAGIRNWRSLVAEDCAQLQIEKPTEKAPAKAYAIFYLDAPA